MRRLMIIGLLVLLLAACGPIDDDTAPVAESLPQVEVSEPGTPVPAMPTPTEAPRDYRSYQHESGLFTLVVPLDWETYDQSTEQRIRVRLYPPPGYASRAIIDATNEGPISPDDLLAFAESYIHLNLTSTGHYTEINRAEIDTGRLQFVFTYNDGAGATGRETVIVQQAGPYVVVMRLFLATGDQALLSRAIGAMNASLTINTQAGWGSSVAAINPAELLIDGDLLWQDDRGNTHYMGRIYNASPADVTDVLLRMAFCGPSGVVLSEVTIAPAFRVIPREESAPFAVVQADLPDDAEVCSTQMSAVPANPDPNYTTSLSLAPNVRQNNEGQLVFLGQVGNPGLAPVVHVEVVLQVYDSEDRLIGLEILTLAEESPLRPGDTLSFEHTFEELGGTSARFLAFAQGTVRIEYSPSLIPTPGEDG